MTNLHGGGNRGKYDVDLRKVFPERGGGSIFAFGVKGGRDEARSILILLSQILKTALKPYDSETEDLRNGKHL